ncbi:MAG TPA: hypothetical protein VEV16_11570 [Daejeonella sp.]|nr:hypothetical protein [Daejeonella sp.]
MKSAFIGRCALLLVSLFVISCSSGLRSLEKGNYDEAVFKAVNRLQRSPGNRKALQTLNQAYNFATDDHLQNIREAKLSSNVLRWEKVIQEYEALNRLANEIRRCPSCREVVLQENKYIIELEEAKYKAAEVRYTRGLKLLEEQNRQSARQAYFDFERADQLYPGFKDTRQKQELAYQLAVLKVVVEPVVLKRSIYELSNEYFQNKIYEYLKNYERRSFIKFYTPNEASGQQLKPDQVLTLSFDDFVVGQTYVKERVEDVKQDSVKVGTVDGKTVYGTVKAKVSSFEKTITSAGLLNLQVTDWQTNNVISQEKMEGTYVWLDRWGTFRGDERALSADYKKLVRKGESAPPAPQYLFIEFTKPLYTQLVEKIKTFYSRY